ncbi:MAG: efflux RND transporter permease subunit, partial [Spirochaetales bacterium]|nr:efflux RND transporter permease subunit [Spirochaetales bacterium]
IEVDLTAAARAGVNPREVHQQLLWSLAAPVADKWTTGLEERDIRIGASSVQARGQGSVPGTSGGAAGGGKGGSALEDVLATSLVSRGTAVPLRALVRLYQQPESGRIYRTNRQRSLSFEVAFREDQHRRSGTGSGERHSRPRAASVPTQLQDVIQEYRFPPEYHAALRLADPRQVELNRSLAAALLLAVLLILCLLLFQFESFVPAGIVMLQVPLSFVLPVFVLRLAALPLSVPAMVGLLLTAGITVNNAILVLDAAWAGSRQSAAPRSALTVTGLYHALTCRLRAMLLASLTTVLGVVPLLFAGHAGRGVLAPLSVTIAAGVAGSLGALILSLAVVGRSGRRAQEPSSAPRRSRRRPEASSRRRSR